MVSELSKMRRNLWIVILGVIGLLVFRGQVGAEPSQQNLPTATAVQVSLPTPLPLIPTDSQQGLGNVSSVTRTPTPAGSALLEALTEANVRSQPDPNSDRLGTIRAGDTYTVIGQYYHWYEFQFDQSPSGTGWVFDELVNVTGNTNRIPDLTQGTPTPDVNAQQVSSTLVVLTQTPGGLLTATAGVGALPLPIESSGVSNGSASNLAVGSPSPLPTFTIPPNLGTIPASVPPLDGTLAPNATANIPQNIDVAIPSKIPPILPILVLGGAGLLGLLVSSLRK
jgi:hypothetical protein